MVRAFSLALACGMAVMLTPALPRAAQQLPDRDTFLREVREAISRSQEAAHRYAYKERRTELRLNPFGRMGTGAALLFEVRPSPNPRLTYRRLIERDGVAVSKLELDRQDAEYASRLKRIAAADDDSPQAAERRRGEDLLARKRAQMIVDDVVGVLQFDLARREVRDGKPQIVIAFAAKPGARPLTREGHIVKAFRGHVWVDETTRELTDVRATAIASVGFGGGFIGKIYEGMETAVERHQIDQGVWMPTRLTLKGDVRAIFRKAHIDHVVEWFDYRAMQ